MNNEIRTYSFDGNGLKQVAQSPKGKNWPVVYLIHDKKNLYIGETTSVATRMGQHLKNPAKRDLKTMEIIFDNRYNKSVVLDYEQRLIKCCTTDSQFQNILNRNKGQQAAHDYYERDKYRKQFASLWKALQDHGLAKKSLNVIENDNIFKFSPYNSLTGEQNEVSVALMNEIIDTFEGGSTGVSLVNGCAGTGKTVLAISVINSLINAVNVDFGQQNDDHDDYDEGIEESKRDALKRVKQHVTKARNNKPFKIGFVFPMPGIRRTVSRVFRECGNGLSADMVIGPGDVAKQKYDILFVDESHRLSKRKNLTSYKSFDDTSRSLGLDPYSTNQLEWILKSAKHVVLFYDEYQSVKSSDITNKEFRDSLETYGNNIKNHELLTQMRCEGGDTYIQYVKDFMNCRHQDFRNMENYDFLLFDDVNLMVEYVRRKDDEVGLSKTVAGFSWKWNTKPGKRPEDNMDYYDFLVEYGKYDIQIDNHRYIWNLSNEDWITRQDSHCTIGCIHTTQGYDMNYVGVIFGKEIDYDPQTDSIKIDLDEYMDTKVKANTEPEVLKNLILNTYTTILARGIKGCYVYAYNENLRNYLKQFIAPANEITLEA